MTYAEMILFIAKSLTISSDNKNVKEVKDTIKLKDVDWDLFVKITTAQLILPALYCNYQRLNLLQYLPNELVAYMQEITSLNRDRNLQIIEQTNELNSLLKQNGVNPIFTKGTSHLIQGLYEDPAERMVSDIDFLVSGDEFEQSAEILLKNCYEILCESSILKPNHRHYPRLVKTDRIAAVEIHKEMLIEKYSDEFNYDTIKDHIILSKGFSFLGFNHQKALSIFSNQINNNEFEFKSVNLRSAYDVFLLSKISPDINYITEFNKLQKPINCFLATSHYLFGEIDTINFNKTKYAENYINGFKKLLFSPQRRKLKSKVITLKVFIHKMLIIIFKTFYQKDYRIWLIKRVFDKNGKEKS